MARPECFEFAMEYLGSPENTKVLKYILTLETALTEEWERNHDDHCDNTHECESFKDGGRECCYPRPEVLL